MQPSGHGFIKTAMIERQADLGVEVSGHYFFKALGGGDDGLFVGAVGGAHPGRGRSGSLADLIGRSAGRPSRPTCASRCPATRAMSWGGSQRIAAAR